MPATFKPGRVIILGLLLITILGVAPDRLFASRIDDIKQRILDRNTEIERLEQEIKQYQTQLLEVGKTANSLTGEITRLDTTRKKLSSDIKVTAQRVSKTTLAIEKLEVEIIDLENKITINRQGIAEAMRTMRLAEEDTLVETMLANQSLANTWGHFDTLNALQRRVREQLKTFENFKEELEAKRQDQEEEKENLLGLKGQLVDQKKIADANRNEKDSLLKQTKNTETNYKKLLQEKLERKEQVEAEIRRAEEELRVEIDPASLPKTGTGILAWPLDKIIVTQYFGNTPFASLNAQVYGGRGHNGIDLGTSVGSLIKAALGGTVRGSGDTDTTCPGASYGKWVLLDHGNGLSTLYAHLSLIKVSAGQSVNTGDIIGYSGNTGYSTGPHLHFSVFASKGVKIDSLQSRVAGCGVYSLPIASYNSYLNPLSYLPSA